MDREDGAKPKALNDSQDVAQEIRLLAGPHCIWLSLEERSKEGKLGYWELGEKAQGRKKNPSQTPLPVDCCSLLFAVSDPESAAPCLVPRGLHRICCWL